MWSRTQNEKCRCYELNLNPRLITQAPEWDAQAQ